MKNNYLGRRVFQNSLVIATTVLTCIAVQAEDHTDKHTEAQQSSQGGPASAQAGHENQHVEKFVQKAMASGQLEVQMGQLGQQQGQDQQVKALAEAIVRDHTQANQKLQQIASAKQISQDQQGQGDHQKHQQSLDKLKSQSGAEFDKEFVRMALKHHKKDIQAFEKAQSEVNDPQLKGFISEVLPKLRQHQQMAQAAARNLDLDEASIAADVDVDTDSSAVGGAPKAESGPREKSPILQEDRTNPDRPRSSLDGATDTDASGTINQNTSAIEADANLGDPNLNASVDVDSDASVDADVDTNADGKIFEKGDGKVLGLPTDKNDGKFLGIIPNPRKDADPDAGVEADVDVDVDADDAAVGGAASVETGESKKDQ
jgi:putative membrane protein